MIEKDRDSGRLPVGRIPEYSSISNEIDDNQIETRPRLNDVVDSILTETTVLSDKAHCIDGDDAPVRPFAPLMESVTDAITEDDIPSQWSGLSDSERNSGQAERRFSNQSGPVQVDPILSDSDVELDTGSALASMATMS